MNPPLLIYHHGVFVIDGRQLPSALLIVQEQMQAFRSSGLLDAATEFHAGINGGKESEVFVKNLLPKNTLATYHGTECRTENLTIMSLFDRAHKVDGEAYFLYEHQKGSSYAPGSYHGENVSRPWRMAMTQDLILNWRQCVADLDAGYDIACTDWRWGQADGTQHIPAGNWVWVKASFVRKLPSMYLRARIKEDGICALSSRYEAEVFWCGGPRPNVKSYRSRLPY